jgi:acetyltransferase-like isoleucine patch superfamily enzyme
VPVESAERLIKEIFPDFDEKLFLQDGATYPSAEYVKVPLTYFKVDNPKGYDVRSCVVWAPRHSLGNIKKRISFEVSASSPHCRFLIFRTPANGRQTFILRGPKSRFLSLSHASMSYTARFIGTSSLIIGQNTFIGSARIIMMETDISIGAGALWSDEIIVQGSDQHGIIDLATRKILNGGRKFISFGRHVWIGRRAIVNKNVIIGRGSIIGTGSIVTKDVPPAVVAAGSPAKVVKCGVTWVNRTTGPIERERDDLVFLQALGPTDIAKSSKAKVLVAWSCAVGLAQAVWVKALAAGAAGALLFELASDIIATF